MGAGLIGVVAASTVCSLIASVEKFVSPCSFKVHFSLLKLLITKYGVFLRQENRPAFCAQIPTDLQSPCRSYLS